MGILRQLTRSAVILTVLCGFFSTAVAGEFVVSQIQVDGLHQLSRQTVLHYVPVKVGQTFDDSMSGHVISSLYKSGYFSDVSLSQSGRVLVVHVVERPTIGLLTITGNKSIDKKQLSPIMEKSGIVEGRFYNPAVVDQLVEGLKQQYSLLGRHAAKVTLSVKDMGHSRVSVQINITEGPAATLKSVQIDGAPQFSQRQLKSNFGAMKTNLTSFISHNNRYSEQKLDQSLENLQNFFLNRGYLQYRLVSKKVDITDDNKGVSIHVTVSPGDVYHINAISMSHDIKTNPELARMVTVKAGDVFSRATIVEINKSIGDYYANQGYAYARVDVQPTLNKTNHTVDLMFSLNKGRLTYVRHIHFSGNTLTQDHVIRYQLRQMEAAPFSLKDVNESKRRISLLPYLKNVDMKTEPVKDRPDEVDLDYSAEEVKAGSASINAGYSDVAGFLYGLSVTEPNFLGSGKMTSVSFQKSDYWTQYSVNYLNPFYKPSGISRGFSFTASQYRPSKVDLDTYDTDQFGVSVNYSMPVSENVRFSWGGGYDYVDVSNVPDTVSPSVGQYIADNPSPYNNITGNVGLSYVGIDKAYFPTQGTKASISATVAAPIFKSSTPYYMLNLSTKTYVPLGGSFIFNPHSILSYGHGYDSNSTLPFFKNIYGGGIETLPGYQPGGLGPYYTYTTDSSTYTSSLGGNLMAIAGVDLIFPNPFPNSLRTSFLVDAGNVFQTADLIKNSTEPSVTGTVTQDSLQLRNLRVTAGLMIQWRTFMPLNFSLAYPLNKQAGDLTQPFSFSAGTSI